MILKQIDTGEYPPGGRLPSEKELEKLYHVSRITAQKAMNLLAEDGRIVRLPGKGSFVIDNAAGISSASAEKQPLIGLILDEFSPSFAYHILHSIQSACEEECCFSKRMRKLFIKNEKSVLRFCNKSSKTKRAFTKVLMPCKRPF